MTRQDQLQLLAVVFLCCVAFIFVVDVGWGLNINWIIRLKWSLLWYTARYLGTICGTLIALDILF